MTVGGPCMRSGLQRRTLLGAALFAVAQPALTLAQSQRPDAAQFFRAPQMLGAALSPDGKRLGMVMIGPHGRALLSVLDLDTMKPSLAFSSQAADVQSVVWVNPTRLAFTMSDRETPVGKLDAGPGLFAVDHDGSRFKQLVERQRVWLRNGNDDLRLEPWNTFLLNGATQRRGDEVLAVRPEAYDGKDIGYLKLLRLNTVRGGSNEVDAPLHSVDWWLDAAAELRVVKTRQGEKSALRWRSPVDGQWKVLNEFNTYTEGDDLQLRHVGPDGRLYITARRGEDKLALWQLNPETGEWSAQALAQSPGFDVDAHIVAREDKVLGWRFTIDAEVTQWLDADMRAVQQAVDKVLPRTVNRLSVPWSAGSPWVLIEAFADIQPSLYFLYHRETRKFIRVGAERPDLDAKQHVDMEMRRFKARDGLEIPVWLSLPHGERKSQLPLVVLVHGGPFVPAPSWRFDAEVQFLAARGYAVLQPQFRGTHGFGAKHQQAGRRQWGKAMQTDLADAARWAIQQGIADPKRIAIVGGSYGGYAALMGLVRDADLFCCAVAWAGVSDLDMLYSVNWDDVSTDFKRHGMPVLLGDRVKDAADLKTNSPLTHAKLITQPLLLAYGSADRRVPLVHGETFRRALPTANGAVEWVVYEDEGHGWRQPANQTDFWNRTARFLDRHLAPKAP